MDKENESTAVNAARINCSGSRPITKADIKKAVYKVEHEQMVSRKALILQILDLLKAHDKETVISILEAALISR